MDQELSDCIRNALVALLYDSGYTIVPDRASLGKDHDVCGFQGDTEPGTASLKLTIVALIGSMHEILRISKCMRVWFDVKACRKAPEGPGEAPRVWEIAALLGLAATRENRRNKKTRHCLLPEVMALARAAARSRLS